MIRKFVILSLIILSGLLILNNVSGYSYSIVAGDKDSETIYRDSGEDIEIEIICSDKSVNL